MRVSIPTLDSSPLRTERVRLAVRVGYDDRPGHEEAYWMDLPPDAAPDVAPSGDPWLVALFPLALTLGEPLEIAAPVDRVLLENVREILRIWARWYPDLGPVEIRCEVADSPATPRGEGTGTFFSAGADSFFTLLRPRDDVHADRRVSIDHLVTLWGYDLPLDRIDAFERLRARCADIAAEFGCVPLDVATNLRETRWNEVDWAHLGHGCALAAIAHALGGRLGSILIPSGAGYGDMRPWASHPLTDPLLSSSRLRVVHDGATAHRVDKLTLVAESALALRELRVCFRSGTDANCGRCPKCVRTMLTFELLGVLDRAACFGEISSVPLSTARRLHCRWGWDFTQTGYVLELARVRGRDDLVRALSAGMAGSKRRNRLLHWLAPARRTRTFARAAATLEDLLLAGWIR